jgi:hypothetical protein
MGISIFFRDVFHLLDVWIMGEDPRLGGRFDLSLSDVKPILKEWGY